MELRYHIVGDDCNMFSKEKVFRSYTIDSSREDKELELFVEIFIKAL